MLLLCKLTDAYSLHDWIHKDSLSFAISISSASITLIIQLLHKDNHAAFTVVFMVYKLIDL